MKKQIEFDHTLLGKEGISVQTREGHEAEVFVSKNRLNIGSDYPIFAVVNDSVYRHTINGKNWKNKTQDNHDLIMYQEVEPRVIWVNIYPNNERYYHLKKEDAEQNKRSDCVETVKFIEVIEEGE